MGTWRIEIEGSGCHHNGPRAAECNDANYLTRLFVRLLRAFHTVTKATFTLVDYTGKPTGEPEDVSK